VRDRNQQFPFPPYAFPLSSKDMLKAFLLSPTLLLYVFLSVFVLVPAAVQAQSNEADINGRLWNKPLYLRGCWRDDTLHFDSNGKLKGKSDPVTFTLAGFELKKLELKPNKLVLNGKRMGLELADNKQKRVSLNSMHIEIEASPTGDYGSALDAIFVEGLAGLVPSLPFYWTSYAQKNFLPVATAVSSPTVPIASIAPAPMQQPALPADTKPHRVKPPSLLSSAEPGFNEIARRLKYSGNALINLWVKPDGTVAHLSVVRAIGLGLDEHALAAVQQYTFAPATEDGKPVLVELNVEVNFQIF
jgi:TonB family protein